MSFAYTGNADPFAFESTMRRDGDEIVVNAEKRMVTGGLQADAFVVYARDEQTGDLGGRDRRAAGPGRAGRGDRRLGDPYHG